MAHRLITPNVKLWAKRSLSMNLDYHILIR